MRVALHELYKYINKYYDQVGRTWAWSGRCERVTGSVTQVWGLRVSPRHRVVEGG